VSATTLFDGSRVAGQVAGLALQHYATPADGSELTLSKLAIASYRKNANGQAANAKGQDQ
jgi:hypothetical protein